MGDKNKKGGLNLEDFINIMKEVGLISKDLGKKWFTINSINLLSA